MFSLTIVFGSAATVWSFTFKERKTAEDCLMAIRVATPDERGMTVIADDFGQKARIAAGQIHACDIEDIDASVSAQNERQLAMLRGRAKLEEAAQSDPDIKRAMQRERAVQAQRGFIQGQHPGPMPMS